MAAEAQLDDRQRCGVLRRQLVTMQEQLRQRALAQYDVNRNAAVALEHSLERLYAVAADCGSGAAPASAHAVANHAAVTDRPAVLAGTARKASAGGAAAASGVAACAADMAALARQRDALSAQCARLQRQCSGLLAYVSFLGAAGEGSCGGGRLAAGDHGNGAADARLWVSLEATQQRRAPSGPRSERVRVRLVLLPAEDARPVDATTAAAAAAAEAASDDDCSGSDCVAAADSLQAARVRVRVKLSVVRSFAGSGGAAPPQHHESCPQQHQWPGSEVAARSVPAASEGAGRSSGRSQPQVGTHPLTHASVPAPGPSMGEAGLAEAVTRLAAAVEEAMAATAATGGGAGVSEGATAMAAGVAGGGQQAPGGPVPAPRIAVTRATLDGLRGVLRQLLAGGAPDTAADGTGPSGEAAGEMGWPSFAKRSRSTPVPGADDELDELDLDELLGTHSSHTALSVSNDGGDDGCAEGGGVAHSARRRFRTSDGLGRAHAAGAAATTAPPRCAAEPRLATPPCSPRSSPRSPAASHDPDHEQYLTTSEGDPDHGGSGSGVGSSWAAAACFHESWEEEGGCWICHRHEHGCNHHFAAGVAEWEELAAAGGRDAAALAAAVVLGSISQQREGLQARATAHDAALQQLAINEGEALLEASRLRSQLEAERAARARLRSQLEAERAARARLAARHEELQGRNPYPRALASVDDMEGGPYTGKKAVVIGAGPAGSTAAMFLARQGFRVEVYERRPEPKNDPVDTGRAYIIILIPRGQAALKELGIKLPDDEQYKTLGTVTHNAKGKTRVSKEEGNVTFSRSSLAQWLIDTARRRYPGRIAYYFNAGADEIDFANNKVVFKTTGGLMAPSRESTYDLLVGADGVASPVRSALAKHWGKDFSVDVDDSGREYKVYMGLRGNIEPKEFQGKTGASLHLYSSDDPFTSFTAHSNPDGTYSGTFSLQTGSFADLKTPADYEAFLRAKFKGIPDDWIAPAAQQFAAGPASPAGKRVRVSHLHGPATVLLGDAAHAVTPVFGQGANSALESCLVLDGALTAARGDLAKVPQAFDAARKPDVHSLYELDRKAYSFFRRKGPFDPDFLQLLAHVVLGTILSKIVPFIYGPRPALLRLGSGIPYSEITAAVRRDAKLAVVLGVVLLLAAVAKLLKLF
ncbi:hypothetical protein GPECTOR_74g701 [Gonium pectorale]|uniref:FAD-binding domain-containing protein n=1 Tax=Gonium pectorale TaxID=33097 RepID=A0A150G2L0_GONPE|nr:hypothetical protein GPECTOR_74g701 [Gonium pectorale]|eukprot:KXZ44087.1 hypothetical protein GPECTOR_74g701 [Gonium pectorale]